MQGISTGVDGYRNGNVPNMTSDAKKNAVNVDVDRKVYKPKKKVGLFPKLPDDINIAAMAR